MTTYTAEQFRAMQGKNKPVKQSQGSQAGKLPPLQEVSTSSLKSTLLGYSPVKQDILNQIEQKKKRAEQLLNEEMPEADKMDVWAFIRKRLHAIEVIKEDLDI